jgi:DNA-binding XRE family transcriptional regulator
VTVTEQNSGRRPDAALQQHLAPSRLGQATAVEQSRAVAEVQAAIVVAQQCPRDITRAERAMRQSCGQKSLAERAFYSYPRAGETITGPSVQLARELARCFGNVQYGISELRRDDGFDQSEMLAFAWDVETNTRSSTTFIVPHKRDTKKGVKVLTDMRDIYENNANNGARRLREMIFAILPAWFTEDAVAECYETIADADGVPMEQRITSAIENYRNGLHVTQEELERKLGAPSSKWSAYDVARLGVIYRSIERGEARREEEFPAAAARVTAAEITGQAASPAKAAAPGPGGETVPAPAETAPAADSILPDAPGTVTREHLTELWGIASTKLGFTRDDKAEWRKALEQIIGRKLTGGTTGNLSADEADALIGRLSPFTSRDDLIALLAELSGSTP